MVSPEEEYIQDVLKRLSRNFYDRLLFAGIIDSKAKLIHFQKGETPFLLPIDRQNALDVQVSLVFSLSKQFEDVAGPLVNTILTCENYEVVVMDILLDSILYVICTKGAAVDIADMLTKLVEDMPNTRPRKRTDHQNQEFVEDEWSGQ